MIVLGGCVFIPMSCLGLCDVSDRQVPDLYDIGNQGTDDRSGDAILTLAISIGLFDDPRPPRHIPMPLMLL